MNIDFIKDPQTLAVIEGILSLVGPNYSVPYDSDIQPSSGTERNNEILTQFDVPGGTTLKSVQLPSANSGMATVIGSLLSVLAPVISAYGMFLPILGIIKGIIEVLCCVGNIFCIIPAVIRLFIKYMPPFLSLFPPLAGLIIIMSTIKLILAIVFFIMTEVVPAVQYIASLFDCVINASQDGNKEKAKACKEKILTLIIILLNKLGILSVLEPLLEIIMSVLQLISGLPCDSGNPDSSCCDDDQCPDEISNPPNGRGLLTRTFFGESPFGWTWRLTPITGTAKVKKLRPYLQDLKSQLDAQLDEPISVASPIGSERDAAHFFLRILGRRGEKFCPGDEDSEPSGSVVVPVSNITSSGSIIVNNTILNEYQGVVDYCVEPNFEQLISNGIIAIGCHSDIIKVKDNISRQFPNIDKSVVELIPEIANIDGEVSGLYDDLKDDVDNIKDLADKPIEDYSLDDIPKLDAIQDGMLKKLTDFADSLKGYLNVIVSRTVDKVATGFEVDKNITKAGGKDKSIVMVTPRNASGTPLMRNMPEDTDLSVELYTDFGVLQNQQTDSSTGTITAELISPLAGTANVMAKVAGDFIETSYEEDAIVKVEQVRFIADAILPKRRKTGSTPEREPGSR